MKQSDINNLKAIAGQIKTATQESENTAERVGGLFSGIVEALTPDETINNFSTDILSLVKAVNSGSTTAEAALSALSSLGEGYNSLAAVATKLKDFLEGATNSDDVINKWKELESFLSGITEMQSLTGLLQQNLNSAKEYADSLREEIQTDYDSKLSDAITMDDVQNPEDSPNGGILVHDGNSQSKKARNSGVLLSELERKASVITDAIPSIGIEDLDNIYGDFLAKYKAVASRESEPILFVVMAEKRVVGTLQVFGDDMWHTLTQVFTTHYILKDGAFNAGHSDSNIGIYYRHYGLDNRPSEGITIQQWTKWKGLYEDASTTTSGLMSAEDKKRLDENVLTKDGENTVGNDFGISSKNVKIQYKENSVLIDGDESVDIRGAIVSFLVGDKRISFPEDKAGTVALTSDIPKENAKTSWNVRVKYDGSLYEYIDGDTDYEDMFGKAVFGDRIIAYLDENNETVVCSVHEDTGKVITGFGSSASNFYKVTMTRINGTAVFTQI